MPIQSLIDFLESKINELNDTMGKMESRIEPTQEVMEHCAEEIETYENIIEFIDEHK